MFRADDTISVATTKSEEETEETDETDESDQAEAADIYNVYPQTDFAASTPFSPSKTKQPPSKPPPPTKQSPRGASSSGTEPEKEVKIIGTKYTNIRPSDASGVEDFYYDDDEGVDYEYEGEMELIPSKHSAATSIDSNIKIQVPVDSDYEFATPIITKMVQKYRRDSENEIPKEEPVPQRGTLHSHSTTKIKPQPCSFFFGALLGTMHQGNDMFSEKTRNKQGLANCISAYVYGFTKPPHCWTCKDINHVLEIGDQLYRDSLEKNHLHDNDRQLKPNELSDCVTLDEKRIKYKLHEPDIAGKTKSKDPQCYDLLRGLVLFFKKHRAGIIQFFEKSVLVWKRKHYYVFDPTARNANLYVDETGAAILANFFDLQSVNIMLLDRSNIGDSPFIISRVSVHKISKKGDEDKGDGDSLDSEARKESQYKIINATKAVIRGTMNINDDCFGTAKGQQSLCVVLTGLVYYHVTPAAAWHSKTIDKLLLIGNQFYLECLKEMTTDEFVLDNIPAFFTVGPLTVELAIYANQHAGFMFKKSNCFFEELLVKFFRKHSTAIVEIDKYVVGIWKQRDFYYLFDPYSRGPDALTATEGSACVTMNGSIQSAVETCVRNFPKRDYIFRIHALKIVKLNRDPEYDAPRATKTVESEINCNDSITVGATKALKEIKPISIDLTEKALKTVESIDMSLGPSVVEIASDVVSLDRKFISQLPKTTTTTKLLSLKKKQFLLVPQTDEPLVYDLDSPSLSDTQLEVERPDPKEEHDDYAMRYFNDVMSSIKRWERLRELEGAEEAEAEDYYLHDESLPFEQEEMFEGPKTVSTQKGRDPGLNMETVEINTDLQGINPLPKIVLEPTDMTTIIKQKIRRSGFEKPDETYVKKTDEVLCEENELGKENNYTILPDGSHILYGSTNITCLPVEDYEIASPYVSLMAVVMLRKYSLHTWTPDVVDYILKCGCQVFNTVCQNIMSFRHLQIHELAVGNSLYCVVTEHLFDSIFEPTIFENALNKILLSSFGHGIVTTKSYSCAVFLKNGIYYMYDGFGCNKLGLGLGLCNSGVACVARFRNLRDLVIRIMTNKKAREECDSTESSRFFLTAVHVYSITPTNKHELIRRIKGILDEECMEYLDAEGEDESEDGSTKSFKRDARTKSKNKKSAKAIGYKKQGRYHVIQGTKGLNDRMDITGSVKVCHFICVCSMLALICKPLKQWSHKRVNYVIDCGKNLFRYIDNTNFADKRNIKNLLVDRYFFDIVVRRVNIDFAMHLENFLSALNYVGKHKYLLIQFPNCCFVLYRSKCYLHLFDCYGLDSGMEEADSGENKYKPSRCKACWIKFETEAKLNSYLAKNTNDRDKTFFFFIVSVSRIKKASLWRLREYKLREERAKKKVDEKETKILHESEDWLRLFPIPWSRYVKTSATGCEGDKWNNWNVEYPNDLFSLFGTIHQSSKGFPRESRGKQTIANCIVSIVMTEIYSFENWNSSVVNSVLRSGNKYFCKTIERIETENYELKLSDFKHDLEVYPYKVCVCIKPVIDGTMFVMRPQQFNLSKALRLFFQDYENRHGIICVTREGAKTKYLAFGRVQIGEYYMFDCQTVGPPMFADLFRSSAYILRCLSINRLVYIMTLTLRGGDFFIYSVHILPPAPKAPKCKLRCKKRGIFKRKRKSEVCFSSDDVRYFC